MRSVTMTTCDGSPSGRHAREAGPFGASPASSLGGPYPVPSPSLHEVPAITIEMPTHAEPTPVHARFVEPRALERPH
jgi:hypothetical protein